MIVKTSMMPMIYSDAIFFRDTEFCEDTIIPNLLVFSPHVDLHDHELLLKGQIILQVL